MENSSIDRMNKILKNMERFTIIENYPCPLVEGCDYARKQLESSKEKEIPCPISLTYTDPPNKNFDSPRFYSCRCAIALDYPCICMFIKALNNLAEEQKKKEIPNSEGHPLLQFLNGNKPESQKLPGPTPLEMRLARERITRNMERMRTPITMPSIPVWVDNVYGPYRGYPR